MSTTTCTACKSLAAVGVKCNAHRGATDARAVAQKRVLANMARGMTVADAEAAVGVTAGPTVR